jgi:hypothetical protein
VDPCCPCKGEGLQVYPTAWELIGAGRLIKPAGPGPQNPDVYMWQRIL